MMEPQLAKEVVEVAVDIGMSQRACEQQRGSGKGSPFTAGHKFLASAIWKHFIEAGHGPPGRRPLEKG